MARARKKTPADDVVALVTTAHAEADKAHTFFRDKVERRYRAYRGIVERSSKAKSWQSMVHPPYVGDVIESAIANIVDAKVQTRAYARPRDASPQEIQLAQRAARAHERLNAYQTDVDRFDSKQRPFVMQDLITGLTVAKTYWRFEERDVPSREQVFEPVMDEFGLPVSLMPVMRETSRRQVLRDDPTFEVVDVRDFFWPESAVSVEKAPWLIHRVWMTMDELRRLEAAGIYQNVDDLTETRSFGEEGDSREQRLDNVERTKGLVEVLEWWSDDRCITVGNRAVLLSDRPNPFWHGQKPFVVASGTPDLFRIPGISEVEKLEQIQDMIWALMNQRLDNISLVNNAIMMYRDDVLDVDEYEFFPGAQWRMQDPSQVQMWTPDTRVADVSLNAESLLKGDLQNVSGGLPFLSGAQSDTVDQNTATGVSIVTSLAQRRIVARKQNYWNAFDQAFNQWAWLNRQFLTTGKLVQVVGRDGAVAFEEIEPDDLQPDVLIASDPVTESLQRQERRAEAQALLQTAAQAAAAFAATGVPLNLKAYMDKYLRSFGEDDVEQFYATPPQAPQMAPGGPQGPVPGTPGFANPEQGPGGVTAPQSIDPATSPSNQVSMSPAMAPQRMAAMSGPSQ